MRRSVLTIIILASVSLTTFAQTLVPGSKQELISPDGRYCFTFSQKQNEDGTKQMYYDLSFNGHIIVEESELGIQIENQLFESALAVPNDTCKLWCENLTMKEVERYSVDTIWKPLYGERARITDRYNAMTLKFQKGADTGEIEGGYDKRRSYFLDIKVRAYNEGVAFCYFLPETTNGLFLHITGEQTQFTFPEGTTAYYERWAQGPYELLPLKGWKDESERPLTLKLASGQTVALAEACMTNYARMKFRLSDTKPNTLQCSLYSSVDVISPYQTPWRVIMVGEKAIDLIADKDIILNLNPPCAIEDPSWIKPGKAFRSGLKQTEMLAAVDFAVARNLQYVHMDSGWYGPEVKTSSDATTVAATKDLNMREIISYASSKGIGVWIYVNQRALYQQLDELLPLYKKWGIKGIKFGFVQIGNQHWTTWLHDAVKKCAEYGLMVDIHDEYRPTGYSRTYPNLLTQEGIRGNEEMPDATHNTILPFTRFLAGPADYTICYYNNRIKNTHAHQLALSVVFYSPLQFFYWYDSPALYKGEPEIEFFDQVKTVWDDSKVIDGEIGEYIITARRSGTDWFLGAITNTEARQISVPTTFLEKGKKYLAHIYEDDEKVDSSTHVRVSTKNISAGETLQFALKASGGVAVRFEIENK